MTPQQQAADFVSRLNDAILYPLIALLTGVAFLVFVYGSAQYVMNATNDSARAEGRKHIMFGLIGLFVMVSAYAILTIASGTFGLNDELRCAGSPTGADCAAVFTP